MSDTPQLSSMPQGGESAFAAYLPLIQAADGLTLAQVCALTSLESSTIQNWIKRGFVPHPLGKKYLERHIARILLIASLRDCMQLDRIGTLMTYINGNADDVSDDIISDVALYDVFHRVVSAAGGVIPTRPAVEECADKVLESVMPPSLDRDRLKEALTIMAIACIAGQYKKQAERLYMEIIKEDNHE